MEILAIAKLNFGCSEKIHREPKVRTRWVQMELCLKTKCNKDSWGQGICSPQLFPARLWFGSGCVHLHVIDQKVNGKGNTAYDFYFGSFTSKKRGSKRKRETSPHSCSDWNFNSKTVFGLKDWTAPSFHINGKAKHIFMCCFMGFSSHL